MSGGLDSALAAMLLQKLGIEVHAVHVSMPWGCGKHSRVAQLTEKLKVPLKVISLGDDYFQVLKAPKYGFGSAFNPCVDCHIYMIRKAAEYMREISASFVFTGEVLGQRPMSQRRQCLEWVERDCGIPGRLLRPLSALHLEPTLVETEGVVDRSRLLDIDGRSRKEQYRLAKELGLDSFAQPAGGCLLTEEHFGVRMKYVLERGCKDISQTAVLGLGKFFRIDDTAFIITGRDQEENDKLIEYAVPGDIILRSYVFPGPAALLRGSDKKEALSIAAGLMQFYSKSRGLEPQPVSWWKKESPDKVFQTNAKILEENEVKNMLM